MCVQDNQLQVNQTNSSLLVLLLSWKAAEFKVVVSLRCSFFLPGGYGPLVLLMDTQ